MSRTFFWTMVTLLTLLTFAVGVWGDDRHPGGTTPGGSYVTGGNASADDGKGTNRPYSPTIQVVGNVESNQILVFVDDTGRKVRGYNPTNLTDVILPALASSGTAWRAEWQAAAGASSDVVRAELGASGTLWRAEWQAAAGAVMATGSAAYAVSAGTAGVATVALGGWPVSSVNGQTGAVVISTGGTSTSDVQAICGAVMATGSAAYATSAGTATTALSVAWSGITGRPAIWSGTATDDVARAAVAVASNLFAPRSWVLGFSNAPVTYSTADATIEAAMPDGTIGQFFEELWVAVKNSSGVPLTNGVCVRVDDTPGERPGVRLVSCTDTWDMVLGTIGLSTMNTATPVNGDGKITTFGNVNDLNTLAFVEGSNLWLSATPGQLTMEKPTAAGCKQVLVGKCLRSHANQGRISVGVRVIPRPEDIGAVGTNDTRYLAALTNAAAFDPAGTAGVISASIATRDRAAQDPNGWTAEDGATWAFATNTRTLTVTGLPGLWVNGVSNPVTSVTAQIGTNTGIWFVYAPNGSTNFIASQTAWQLYDSMLATVYNDNDGGATTNYVVADETHTAWMPWRVHRRFHDVPGTAAAYSSGLTLTISAVNNWSVSVGRIYDEDIQHNLPVTNACWIAHRKGSYGRLQRPTSTIYATNGAGAACWDNAGTLQAVTAGGVNNYFSMWLYALDLHTGPSLIAVVGQSESTLANIRAEAPPANLANVVPGAEAVLLYQVILRGSAGTYTEAKDYRLSKVTSAAALSEVDPVWTAAKAGIEAGIAAANETGAVNTAALTVHTNRTDNPHSVTAAQVGADPAGSSAAVQASFSSHAIAQTGINVSVSSGMGSLTGAVNAANTTGATHTVQIAALPSYGAVTSTVLAVGMAQGWSTNVAWTWQGAQIVAAPTNLYRITYRSPAVWSNNQHELLPYSTTNYGAAVTGVVTITMVSNIYLASIGGTWNYRQGGDILPAQPVRVSADYASSTTAVLTARCSTNPADAAASYYAYFSNLVVYTYDRTGMQPLQYTNDAAGIVARVDPLPEGNTDQRRVVNQESLTTAIAAAKPDIAKEAWSYTPSGGRQPSASTLTIDKPLVQQGTMAYLQSGDYFAASYQGGDWFSVTTGSVWRLGPGGRVAFEVSSTNRMLFIQAFSVATNWATIDVATNWITGAPYAEFCADLGNPQWLAAPSQIVASNADYWRIQCPATATQRFYRAVSPGGANAINSYYQHNFLGGVSGITAADVGAVPTSRTLTIDGTTYDLSSDRSWTTAGGGLTAAQATGIAQTVVGQIAAASYYVTNTVVISNSLDWAITGLPANNVKVRWMAMYLSATNEAAVSKRMRFSMFNRPDRMCDGNIYTDTNQLYWSANPTVAEAVGSVTGVVADASGVVPFDRYAVGGGTTWDFLTATQTTATVIWWACTNKYATATNATTKISHANYLTPIYYDDDSGQSSIWCRAAWTTPYTGTVTTVVRVGK